MRRRAMEDDKKNEHARRVYEKPVLRSIELVAEEVLAVGCKGTAIPGPSRPTCVLVNCAARIS